MRALNVSNKKRQLDIKYQNSLGCNCSPDHILASEVFVVSFTSMVNHVFSFFFYHYY